MKRTYIATVALLSILTSCAQTADKDEPAPEPEVKAETAVMEAPEETTPAIDVDALVNDINAERERIESNLGEPMVISTEDLRAKVKQKWSTIHIYTENEKVVRVKTYPHDGVSSRTEEFYLQDGSLILAVIEDDGTGERGKAIEEMSKAYYYHEGEMIKEVNAAGENEYTIKDSDAEELIEEVNEYLKLQAS